MKKTNLLAGIGLALSMGGGFLSAGHAASTSANSTSASAFKRCGGESRVSTRRLVAGRAHVMRLKNRAKSDGIVTRANVLIFSTKRTSSRVASIVETDAGTEPRKPKEGHARAIVPFLFGGAAAESVGTNQGPPRRMMRFVLGRISRLAALAVAEGLRRPRSSPVVWNTRHACWR